MHCGVWYDEYELTMGDSLLGKINAGLASCDYGVVVLSPAYFKKKWPQAELDGLFALEQPNRKVILPIWKDIDEAEVRAFSSILAGRIGVPASIGIATSWPRSSGRLVCRSVFANSPSSMR